MLSPEGLPHSDVSICGRKNGGCDTHNWAENGNGLEPAAGGEFNTGPNGETNLGIRIDAICRVMFPFNFILFNVFYWGYYLNYWDRAWNSLVEADGVSNVPNLVSFLYLLSLLFWHLLNTTAYHLGWY